MNHKLIASLKEPRNSGMLQIVKAKRLNNLKEWQEEIRQGIEHSDKEIAAQTEKQAHEDFLRLSSSRSGRKPKPLPAKEALTRS